MDKLPDVLQTIADRFGVTVAEAYAIGVRGTFLSGVGETLIGLVGFAIVALVLKNRARSRERRWWNDDMVIPSALIGLVCLVFALCGIESMLLPEFKALKILLGKQVSTMSIHQMPAEVLEATRTLLAANCAACAHKRKYDEMQERYDSLIQARLRDAKMMGRLEYQLAQARGDNG